MQTTKYIYLSNLSKTEFSAVLSILKKHGIKGLLGIVLELAQFNLRRSSIPADHHARAERVERELGALIERLDGFEDLIYG